MSVLLDTGVQSVPYNCPEMRIGAKSSIGPIYGLVIDPGQYGPLYNGFGNPCLRINGLYACEATYGGILLVGVHLPGVTRPVAVEIGLAGGGKVARTILYSIRSSESKPSSMAPSTTESNSREWPSRVITTNGNLQDIVPIQRAVYWLSIGGPQVGTTEILVTPMRYDLSTGALETGPGISSDDISSGDLAVAGGYVWVAVGSGTKVVLVSLDSTTLAVRDRVSLPVKNDLSTASPDIIDPVITSTTNGPLWAAGGEDLWALNPVTGAIETEFNTGDEIASLSTDPAGHLLYTGGVMDYSGDWRVGEYDAHTGKELLQTVGEAVSAPIVAATTGGVWVSQRFGMSGAAVELSASALKRLAPPTSELQGFGTYDQIGGVWSSVSEGTLWLTSASQVANLVCADPATGAVRASELTTLGPFAPIAIGHVLYALTSPLGGVSNVVVIAPPAKCFG